jgi:hypothetical protein
VLQVDDNGNPVGAPPAVVTVNGSKPTAASTLKPTRPRRRRRTPTRRILIIDQPFTYGGSTFVVPKVWTTILPHDAVDGTDERQTGVSAWAELASPTRTRPLVEAAAPHTITVPHDMPFLAAMGQICLRIDNLIVEGATSHRALRIFETTHQKTLIQVDSSRRTAPAPRAA